jgi:hypothetical protein
MRSIPGTITQYGIENTVKPASPGEFIVKVTSDDASFKTIVYIGEDLRPLTEESANELLDFFADADLITAVKVKI